MEKEQINFLDTTEDRENDRWKIYCFRCNEYDSCNRKLRKNRKFRARFIYSITQCFAYMVLGWMKAQIGPAFLDILLITNADLNQGAVLRTLYYSGVVIGCLACAAMFDRISTPLLSAAIFGVACVDVAAIPWCSVYEVMVAAHLVQGFCFGIFDTMTFAEAIRIWKNNTKSYMQIVAFVFTLASVISPLVTAPFLTETVRMDTITVLNITNTSSLIQFQNNSTKHVHWKENRMEEKNPNFFMAYTITAILAFIAFIMLLSVWIAYRDFFKEKFKPEAEVVVTLNAKSEEVIKDYTERTQVTPSLRMKLVYIVILSLFFGVFTAVDYTFTDFLAIFCVRHMKWTTKDGAFITSIVFVASLISRFASIFIVRVCRLDMFMLLLLLTLIVSFIGMIITAQMLWSLGMWLFSALVGVALGPVPGLLISWTNEKFVSVNGKVSSALFVTAFAGATVNPPLLSYLFYHTTHWFAYLFVTESVLTLLIFLFALLLYKLSNRKKQ